ncbi:MAG: Pyrimidine-specific ribonucleoside hydrolase RihA [Herbaspirillum frisingense]|uniref:Pyrimidine-specific ribonucleoside hydrolase RihA n=1 Tax=Herbaspirillum frisingense TaxID=92645 RepID=A0A7V8JTD3_9BURK|nr:MAG: Pyrimidine-specific ribonucleoside hydrolase RihA [Herbaspirillum frisingense]
MNQTTSQHHAIPVIIDCDPGIDDALALLLAAGSSEIGLRAITTVAGNRPVQTTSHNARKILDLAGLHEVPVYAGAQRPLYGSEARCNLVHGEDGLGGVQLPEQRPIAGEHAANALVRLLQDAEAGSIELVAIGPLSNLAMAELLAPGILRRARRLLVMGGALRVPGNITPTAEFNFYADPLAADIVMRSGAQIVLFPLDVTHQAIMSADWIASFAGLGTRCGTAAAAMLKAYAELDPLLHDACPVAYLLQPRLFGEEACELQVDWRPGATEGYALARFFHKRRGFAPNVQAATTVDNHALLALVKQKIDTLS